MYGCVLCLGAFIHDWILSEFQNPLFKMLWSADFYNCKVTQRPRMYFQLKIEFYHKPFSSSCYLCFKMILGGAQPLNEMSFLCTSICFVNQTHFHKYKAVHQNLFWKRGKRQLENGSFQMTQALLELILKVTLQVWLPCDFVWPSSGDLIVFKTYNSSSK